MLFIKRKKLYYKAKYKSNPLQITWNNTREHY